MDKVQKDLWGWAVLIAAVGGLVWYLENKASTAVSTAIDTVANDIGGGAYDLVEGDANTQVQTATQALQAALVAAGSPEVGSAAYNQVMINNGRPDLVVNPSG